VEPDPKQFGMAGAGAKIWMVEPELKFGFRFHRNSLWGKRVAQIMQCFILFFGPNWSGAGAKSFKILEPV